MQSGHLLLRETQTRHPQQPRGSDKGGMALGQPPPSCRSQQLSRGNCFIWVVEQKAMGQPSWGRCQTFSITSDGSAPGPAGEMQVMLVHSGHSSSWCRQYSGILSLLLIPSFLHEEETDAQRQGMMQSQSSWWAGWDPRPICSGRSCGELGSTW